MLKSITSGILASLALATLSGLVLAGCGSSDDGAMLSDEEKIKKSHEGRAEYDRAMKGRAPTANAPGE